MSILSDLRGLFYPSLCPVCGGELPEGGRTVCTLCRMTAPLTRFWEQADNPMMRRLWGHVPVVGAAAFIWYVEGSGWQRLIHAFKYHGRWRLALEMGTWYGACLADAGAFADADALVPVPLHWIRRLGRGYNQSEYLAAGLARALDKPVWTGILRRRRNNPSQTGARTPDRWSNVQDLFALRRPERLAGRHILLVDDVFTTGATLVSCAEAILAAVPDCRISMATLAVSARSLGPDRKG